MSQPPIDPETLQQTKQEIRNLAREIAELSKQDLAPPEYFEKFLSAVVTALAAVGGAVWTLAEGRLSLLYQINMRTTELMEGGEDQQRHSRLLQRVAATGEPIAIPPYSGASEADEAGNPTRFLLILVPLKSEQDVEGVIEIFQRPGASADVQRGYLRFMASVCELANGWIKSRKLRQISDKQTLWQRLEQLSQVVHESLDLRETAFVVANEVQRFVGCDRVTVVVRKGTNYFIEAISGQDQIDHRSNTVALLQKLTRHVLAAGDPLWFTGSTEDQPPQIEAALEDYVDHAHSKTVAIIPLHKPVRPNLSPVDGVDEESQKVGEILGALIIEQIEDSTNLQTMRTRTELVQQHVTRAIANAHEHNSLVLLPVWKAISNSLWVFRARTLPKTLTICGVVIAAILASLLIRVDFNLKGPGELQPVNRQDVFAGVDGVVTAVHKEHGDRVEAGEPLITLRNTDLLVQMENVAGQERSVLQQILSTERTLLDTAAISAADRSRLSSELLQLRQQLVSYKAQYALLKKKCELLTVKSPISGQVISWDPKKQLINRPIAPGQVLLTVADADPDDEWELLVYMPEDNVGYVMQAVSDGSTQLPVTYVLATNPGTSLRGTLQEIHGRAEVHKDDAHAVKLRVKINRGDLTAPRPGATATVKVNCGKRSIAFTWLHDVVEFVQTKLFF